MLKRIVNAFLGKKLTQSEGLVLSGVWTFTKHDAQGNITFHAKKKNIVPTVGKAAFARQLAGSPTYDVGDNLYIAIGTDTTPVSAADTQLGTESQRKIAGSAAASSNVVTIAVFFNASEVGGDTYEEFGLFGSGNATLASATVNTGILYSHVLFPVSVSITETLTVSFEFTFS